MRRTYPPKAALPFLAAVTLISVASVAIRNAKPIGMFLRLLGAGSAVGYVAIDAQRRKIESGEQELDTIALATEALKVQWNEFESRRVEVEEDILAGIAEFDKEKEQTLAEIEQEWQTIESQKQELTKLGAELSARRVTLEFEQETWEKEATLRVKKLELELHDLKHEIEVREYNIELRESEFKTMSRTLALEEQVKLEQAKEEMLSDHQSRLSEIQQSRDEAIVDREILEEKYLQMSNELEAARAEFQSEYEIRQQKIQEEIEVKQAELEAIREQLILDCEEAIAGNIAENQQYIDELHAIIANLADQIDQRDALKEFGAEDKYAGVVGNWILEVIRNAGIQVHPHLCRGLPWGTHNQPAIVVWLKLGNGAKLEDIARIKTSIEGRVAIHPLQMAMDKNGFVVFAIGDVRGAVQMPEQPASDGSKGTKSGMPVESKITEPSPQVVEQILGRSFFYMVAGPPRSGKTALTNNLIAYRAAHLGKKVGFVINDLKFPDPGTPWIIRGEKVIPKYCLIEPVEGLEKFGLCPDGLTEMYASALARKNQRLLDVANDRPLSRFNKRMWIIDECPALSDGYRTLTRTCISNTVRIGGALDEVVVFIGQSYNPDDFGLRRPMLQNVTQVYIGASYALEALRKRQVPVDQDLRKKLTTEIHARSALAAKQIEEGVLVNGQPPAKYFALIAGEGEAFLMTLPPPGAFDNMSVAEADADEDAPVMSDEELVATVKSTIYEEIEKLKDEVQGESDEMIATNNPAKTAPGFNTAEMTPLQRSIVEFCQSKVGQMFTPSAIYSGSREVQKAIEAIQRGQKPAQKQRPSALVEVECNVLTSEWGVGAIEQGAKGSVKFGIQR